MKSVKAIVPPNFGWLEVKLDDTEMKYLWDCLKNQQKSHKKNLAGNVTTSCLLIDKDNWFFDNVIYKLIMKYADEFGNLGDDIPVTRKHPYYMPEWWSNYQKQHEFNPLHDHGGVYSFVIWMKIPTNYFEQRRDNKFAMDSNSRSISNFSFEYTNILGGMKGYTYEMSSKLEGALVFFPAALNHLVYPFYNCKEDRISISGNILLDTSKTLS